MFDWIVIRTRDYSKLVESLTNCSGVESKSSTETDSPDAHPGVKVISADEGLFHPEIHAFSFHLIAAWETALNGLVTDPILALHNEVTT